MFFLVDSVHIKSVLKQSITHKFAFNKKAHKTFVKCVENIFEVVQTRHDSTDNSVLGMDRSVNVWRSVHSISSDVVEVRRVGAVKPAFPRRCQRRQKFVGTLFLARLVTSCRLT